MKKNISFWLQGSWLMLLICLHLSLQAQNKPKPCGTYRIDTARLNQVKRFAFLRPLVSTGPITVRIAIHILMPDKGTDSAATSAQINSELAILSAEYASYNVYFLLAGLSTIHDTSLDSLFDTDRDDMGRFIPFLTSKCINVFYVAQLSGTNSNCNSSSCSGIGGIAYNVPALFCLIAQSNIGVARAIAHEVGHCIGLFHTFESRMGLEDIDGSNSADSGDLVQDTPADPFAYYSDTVGSCFAVTNNRYTGTCTDPKG
ncbi:MAG: hypothetical protein ABUT20_55000 [Bacteroidota bacterium]